MLGRGLPHWRRLLPGLLLGGHAGRSLLLPRQAVGLGLLPARLLLRRACQSLLPVRLLPGLGRPLLAVRLAKGLRLLGPLLLVLSLIHI